MKQLYPVIMLVLLGSILAGCTGAVAPAGSTAASPNTLTAMKVDATALDANAAYWEQAPKLEVATKAAKEGNPDGPAVTLQAVYDDGAIAVRAEWVDDTETLLKHAWTWDGAAFTMSGDEDRAVRLYGQIGFTPQ